MDGLMVSQLASRSGVPASTVRFYEQRGLLPARRSGAGYRLYDDDAVHRLAFIGTAKQLGLPLEEIRRLLEPWQHGSCVDVRDELRPLLEQRIDLVHERMTELRVLAEHLRRARRQLDTIDRAGPCDPSCTFLGRNTQPAIACDLDDADRLERLEQWRTALAQVTAREGISGGVRLTFAAGTRPGALAELAAAEAECCAFFELTVGIGPPVVLEATAPPEALELVHDLFGDPDR